MVLVGASPNLDFLEEQGCNLGIVLDKPSSRINLMDKDLSSQESVRQTSIYATYGTLSSNLSTAIAWREKITKHFVFNKYFSLVLGILKSKISKKSFKLFLRKLDFKLFHYKTRVQRVSKINTIATINRC